MVYRIVGIDPGLVHTGMVVLSFYPSRKELLVNSFVINGIDVHEIEDSLEAFGVKEDFFVFIEAYRPRSHFNTDVRMTEGMHLLKALPYKKKIIPNMGVKQIITSQLLTLLHLKYFSKKTNHDDLQAAARIALFGMVKDEELNKLLSDCVSNHIAGNTWQITHQ